MPGLARVHAEEASDQRNDPLTRRQVEILQLTVADLSVKEIARELTISVRTVEGHFANMRRRTRLKNIGALIAWAVGEGVVTVSPPQV
jgi:two-component system secretion response regulator SsrB